MQRYSPKAIANYFLKKGHRHGIGIDPMKVQKLVYFSHGWCLAVYDRPLIDERVDAWPYGPVIPSVYHEFKRYGRDPIRFPAFYVAKDGQPQPYTVPEEDRETIALLDRIWEVYGGLSAVHLSNMTHVEGSPWHQVVHDNGGEVVRGTDISDDTIKSYFLQVAQSKA